MSGGFSVGKVHRMPGYHETIKHPIPSSNLLTFLYHERSETLAAIFLCLNVFSVVTILRLL